MNTPVGVHADQTLSWAFVTVAAIFCLVSICWAVSELRRNRGLVALLALSGGLIASFEEPWINLLIKLWYPPDAPLIGFTALGHAQPLYVQLVYPGFVGLGAYVVYRGLLAHPDGSRLWPTFLGICALDLVFELPATASEVFVYYGPQPLQLFDDGWPLWVAPINAAGPVLAGWLLYRLVPVLRGGSQALLVLLPPLAYAGVYGAVGWPTYTVLNSDVPAAVRTIAALFTIGLCVAIAALVQIATTSATDTAARRERELVS